MPYTIGEDCSGCGICVVYCPVNCIQEEALPFVIEAQKCTDCGVCAEYCPMQVISPGPVYPVAEQSDTQ